MKTNTLFSFLPHGTLLYRGNEGEAKFLFNTSPEKASDSQEVATGSVDQMMDRLHTKAEVRQEMDVQKQTIESTEKKLTAEELRQESERMRAEVERLAREKLETEFKSLNESLNKRLVVEYGRKFKTSDPDQLKAEIKKYVESLPPAGREAFIQEMQGKLQDVVENNNFIKRAWKATGEYLNIQSFQKENNQDLKTRGGNFLGAGVTTLYIVGIFAGAEKSALWYSALIAGGISAVLPGVAADAFHLGSWTLDKTMYLVREYFTHIKNGLVAVARLDANQLWDGTTKINDRRAEIVDNFQNQKFDRPQLKMKGIDGKRTDIDLIDEEMHQRFQSLPLKGKDVEQKRKKLDFDQCQRAAKYCVEVFDPQIILTDKNITPEQKRKLAKLTRGPHAKFDQWDQETLQLISRTFASREAVLAWNYFMIHSSIEERDNFVQAFADNFEAQKAQRRGQLPAETQKEISETIQNLYPDIDKKLSNMTPEGIASFMKEGGLEDILVLLSVAMAGVYTAVGIGYGFKKWREYREENHALSKPEKYRATRKKAKENLENVLSQDKIGKTDWKDALKYLFQMGVIHKIEKEKLEKISDPERDAIIAKMKANNFAGKASIADDSESMKKLQDDFWECVDGNIADKDKRESIGTLNGESKEKREKARDELMQLRDLRKAYEKFKENPAYKRSASFWQVHIALANKGREAQQSWKQFQEWEKTRGKQRKALKWEKTIKIFSENNAIYERLQILGVHENEIALLKSISKKDGARKTAIYDKIDDILKCYPTTSSQSDTPTPTPTPNPAPPPSETEPEEDNISSRYQDYIDQQEGGE